MQSNFYVGMSGQMSVERRLQSIASNIANMNSIQRLVCLHISNLANKWMWSMWLPSNY